MTAKGQSRRACPAAVRLEVLESRQLLAAGAGSLDPSFGQGGQYLAPVLGDDFERSTGVTIQRDGKIVVAGWTSAIDFRKPDGLLVARFNPDGSPDKTFGPARDGQSLIPDEDDSAKRLRPDGLAIQQDGKIVVATEVWGGVLFARLNPDGRPDKTFGSD